MFKQARLYTPVRLWKLSLWSLWINRFTYPVRLICVAVALKTTGTPPMDLSKSYLSEEEETSWVQ